METEEWQIPNQKHYYKRLRLGNSWEVSSDLGAWSSLEDLHMDGQVGFRVFADCRDQVPSFHQHLVGVVIQRRIDHQLARRAFTLIQPVQDGIKPGDRGVELLRQLFILGQ